MAATTNNNVFAIAPELADFTPSLVNLVLSDVNLLVGGEFGVKQEVAQRYLAAHLLTLLAPDSGANQASGPVTQERVGNIMVKYAEPKNMAEDEYNSTKYGRMFLKLMKSCIIGAMAVTP